MSPESIYLDANATTMQAPAVTQAMLECYERFGANPASQHRRGRDARRRLEDAREGIAELLGARIGGPQADQLIFTSGGTEANNLAIFGLSGPPGSRVIISSIEHPCVEGAAEQLAKENHHVDRIPVDRSGVIDPADLEALLTDAAHLVSVMLANHETGAVQPVQELASKAHERRALLHTDAVQAVGKLDIDFHDLGVDAMTVTAHKCHGPLGIGALLLQHGVKLQPRMFGGSQQYGLRPGTENVALAVGMHTALSLWREETSERYERMQTLRNRFEELLLAEIPGLVVHSHTVARLPQTTNLAFPGIERQAFFMALDMAGVACSTGSACQSGSSEPSPTLLAMGCEKGQIDSSLRFSLSAATGAAEVEDSARRIIRAYKHLRKAN